MLERTRNMVFFAKWLSAVTGSCICVVRQNEGTDKHSDTHKAVKIHLHVGSLLGIVWSGSELVIDYYTPNEDDGNLPAHKFDITYLDISIS